jgi:fumarate hydratase subunit beta
MKIKTPLTDQDLASLKSGDQIYLSGTIYTGRDAAHKRLVALIKENKDLPFNFNGTAIYYVGPSPKKPNQVIGSAGPTSSYRMDAYSPLLMEH